MALVAVISDAPIAQWIEYLIPIQMVVGSIPTRRANKYADLGERLIPPSWKGGVPTGTTGSNPVVSAIY